MKIAFIGLGRMGQAMAGRLLQAGHELIVYNRTRSKLKALTEKGAQAADSVAQAASGASLVITMLADDAALRMVTQQEGLLQALPAGAVHIASGTHSIQAIRALQAEHQRSGSVLLCAPMLGRPDAVAAGRASVIAAGDAAALERARPVLESIGRRVFVAGSEPGTAAAVKLANNFLLACAIEAMGEAFALVRKSGVQAEVLREVLSDGLFASPAYSGYARIIAEQRWDEVGFTVALGLKDVNTALAAGELARVPLPSGSVCRDRLLGALAHGDGDKDWAAMALEQARASGLA